jgi:hypothetical protein
MNMLVSVKCHKQEYNDARTVYRHLNFRCRKFLKLTSGAGCRIAAEVETNLPLLWTPFIIEGEEYRLAIGVESAQNANTSEGFLTDTGMDDVIANSPSKPSELGILAELAT